MTAIRMILLKMDISINNSDAIKYGLNPVIAIRMATEILLLISVCTRRRYRSGEMRADPGCIQGFIQSDNRAGIFKGDLWLKMAR